MLRNWLRRWLGVEPAPAAAPLQAPPGMAIHPQALSLLAAVPAGAPAGLVAAPHLMASYQGMPIVARKIEAPALPRGVVPETHVRLANDEACGPHHVAFDSAADAPAYTYLNQYNAGWGFPGYAYLAQLTQRSEYRAPAETIGTEMTREWIAIKTKGKTADEDDQDDSELDSANDAQMDDDGAPPVRGGTEDKIEDLVEWFEQKKVREHFAKIAELDCAFGRAQLYPVFKGGEAQRYANDVLPLLIDPKTFEKGSLDSFAVVEPIWTTPYYYNATDPTRPDFYRPVAWYVMGRKIHASRLLTFVSRELPDILKPAYNFGGISLTQLMEPYVYQWLRTRNSVSDLIHNFSIVNLSTNLAALLSGDADGKGMQGLLDRAKAFTLTRDNQGLMLTDKDTEVLTQTAVPLSSLDALQAQAQEHMAAPTHIPLVKLLGITPTGLNASSEGEIKVFYDFIRGMQQKLFAPHLKTVLEIAQLDLFGEIDDAITFDFVPLTSPSVKELAEIRKSDADSGRAYIEAGVIGPDEERERLQNDPNSGYANLSGPAPEPPEPELVNPDGTPYDTGAAPPDGLPKPTEDAAPLRAVAAGTVPLETARATIAAAFPQLTPEQIGAILKPLKGFTPTSAPSAP